MSNSHGEVVVIDYGMGNLGSIKSALEYLGASPAISADPAAIKSARRIILPGVGSFSKAMANLKAAGLISVINEAVNTKQIPIMGICLGMQLLCLSSTEDGSCEGLSFFNVRVDRFDESACAGLKIPHVGFDTVSPKGISRLFKGLAMPSDFYFTHSYKVPYENQDYVAGVCDYGQKIAVALERDHICGTQFHPEKSQSNGLHVLKNFIENF